jgi:2-dehydropantoate 2-reductase
MASKKLKFLVVGLGPVGGAFAALLSADGHYVAGVDVWQDHIDTIRNSGLTLAGLFTKNVKLSQVCNDFADLEERSYDYVVIAVKAAILEKVIPSLELLEGKFQVVALQNGIDNEEFLGERIGREKVMRMVANYAGCAPEPGLLKLTFFNGPNYAGCFCSTEDCDHSRELATALTEAGLDTEAAPDIKRSVWRKAILNAALTPVCSLLDMTMADVMSCHETFHVVEMVLDECIKVARARGYDFGEGFLDYCLDYLSRGGHHKPSMLYDLKNGLVTEIDFLNGKIVSHGIRLGVPVPVNTTLTAMVKAREMGAANERRRKDQRREDQ